MILYKNGTIEVKTIEAKDIESIIEISKEDNSSLLSKINQPNVELKKTLLDIINNKDLSKNCLILEYKDTIVSYMLVSQTSEQQIKIKSCITKRKHRNRGFGTFLINFIKIYANQNNLEVNVISPTSGNLFRQNGFKRNLSISNDKYTYLPSPSKVNSDYKIPIFLSSKEILSEKQLLEARPYQKSIISIKDI